MSREQAIKAERALKHARPEHETKVTKIEAARAAVNRGESALKLRAEQLGSSRLERLRWIREAQLLIYYQGF